MLDNTSYHIFTSPNSVRYFVGGPMDKTVAWPAKVANLWAEDYL